MTSRSEIIFPGWSSVGRLLKREHCQFGWLRVSVKSLEGQAVLVTVARYVPNRQFLSIPFRSELVRCGAQV